MLSKRKVIKLYKGFKAHDISHRVPVLAVEERNKMVNEERKTERRYTPLLAKKALVCACIAVVIIVSAVTASFPSRANGNQKPSNNGENNQFVVDNTTSGEKKDESKEISQNSNENNEYSEELTDAKIIYASEIGTSIGGITGHTWLGCELDQEMNNPENDDSLFAVWIENYNLLDADNSRFQILGYIARYLDRLKTSVYCLIENENDGHYDTYEFNLNQLISVDYQECVVQPNLTDKLLEYEATGGFDKEIFDQATIDIICKLVRASEEQFRNPDFIRQIDKDLDYIYRPTGIVGPRVRPNVGLLSEGSMLYHMIAESRSNEMQSEYDKQIEYFKSIGIQVRRLSHDECIRYGLHYTKGAYEAFLTKEQLQKFYDTPYELYVTLQQTRETLVAKAKKYHSNPNPLFCDDEGVDYDTIVERYDKSFEQ